jgi:3D (Asp-Asp-Asp) domain-containing protein
MSLYDSRVSLDSIVKQGSRRCIINQDARVIPYYSKVIIYNSR